MADQPQPVAGGSGLNQPQNPIQNQNVVIDPAAQGAAAQLARQILANTNVTLKQEVFKIPEFFGEKTKDTVTAQEFILRIDECQISNDWNDTTTFANFRLCLRGEAEEWLSSTVRHLKLTAAQKTWTRIRPLFKREFATTTDDKLIVDGLAKSSTRTLPPTGSNRTGPLSFQTVTTRRMHLHNMRTILSKLTTNFFLHKFSRLLLQKMFANCCHTKTRHDSQWMRLTKLSSRSTEWNKTSAYPQQSTCMRSRISKTRRRRP